MPNCPFCDQPILPADMETVVSFGGQNLHRRCHIAMNEDLDAAYGEPDTDDLQQVVDQQQHDEELETARWLCGA